MKTLNPALLARFPKCVTLTIKAIDDDGEPSVLLGLDAFDGTDGGTYTGATSDSDWDDYDDFKMPMSTLIGILKIAGEANQYQQIEVGDKLYLPGSNA